MKKNNSQKFFAFVLLLTLVAIFSAPYFAPAAVIRSPGLSTKQINSIIESAGQHLLTMQKPDGSHTYEINPFTGATSEDNNIVRQLGTLYAYSELYTLTENTEYLAALKKTAEHWLAKSATAVRNEKTIRYFPDGDFGKLGTSALFIIGTRILKAEDPVWWAKNKNQIAEVENMILYLRKPDWGLAQSFDPRYTDYQKNQTSGSEYYDGEALLALLYIYQSDPRPEIKTAIYETVDYIERQYTHKPYAKGLYLWLLTSMRLGYEIFEDEKFVRLADYYQGLREKNFPIFKKKYKSNVCTVYEGLGNWLMMHKNRGTLKKKQKDFFEHGLKEMTKLQVKPSAAKLKLQNGVGGFLTARSEKTQRIDFQQHCITAFRTATQL